MCLLLHKNKTSIACFSKHVNENEPAVKKSGIIQQIAEVL